MLLELRDYIHERGSVSITDVSNRFRIPPDALRGMLGHWVRKGLIEREVLEEPCGSCRTGPDCGECGVTSSFEVYKWVNHG